MIKTAICENYSIVIDKLDDKELRAHCEKCKQKVTAKRENYSRKEWEDIIASANDHTSGVYNK